MLKENISNIKISFFDLSLPLSSCYNYNANICWGGGMADTRALRALIRKGVGVRLPPSAPLLLYAVR